MRSGIACCLLLLAGLWGCRSASPEKFIADQQEETRAAIRSVVKDPQRSAAMLAVVDVFQADVKTIAADTAEIRKRIAAAQADYDTSRAEMQKLYDELGVQVDRLCGSAKRHSTELRRQCSEVEWNAIMERQGTKAPKNIL
jgi:hypothetical protein